MLSVKKISSTWRAWTAVSATLLAALLAAFCALPASAASAAVPAAHQVSRVDGHSCNPNPIALVVQCTRTDNTGLKLKSMSGRAYNNTTGTLKNLHIQLYWTNGKKSKTIKNCEKFNLPPDLAGSPPCDWGNPHPNRNVRSGNYCSRTWQHNDDGTFTILSSECVPVKR